MKNKVIEYTPDKPSFNCYMFCNHPNCITPTGRKKYSTKYETYLSHIKNFHPEHLDIFKPFQKKLQLEKRKLDLIKMINDKHVDLVEEYVEKLNEKEYHKQQKLKKQTKVSNDDSSDEDRISKLSSSSNYTKSKKSKIPSSEEENDDDNMDDDDDNEAEQLNSKMSSNSKKNHQSVKSNKSKSSNTINSSKGFKKQLSEEEDEEDEEEVENEEEVDDENVEFNDEILPIIKKKEIDMDTSDEEELEQAFQKALGRSFKEAKAPSISTKAQVNKSAKRRDGFKGGNSQYIPIIPQYILLAKEIPEVYEDMIGSGECLDFCDELGNPLPENEISRILDNWYKPVHCV
jgi:hypothetical protein